MTKLVGIRFRDPFSRMTLRPRWWVHATHDKTFLANYVRVGWICARICAGYVQPVWLGPLPISGANPAYWSLRNIDKKWNIRRMNTDYHAIRIFFNTFLLTNVSIYVHLCLPHQPQRDQDRASCQWVGVEIALFDFTVTTGYYQVPATKPVSKPVAAKLMVTWKETFFFLVL